jgi:hypothetical protein
MELLNEKAYAEVKVLYVRSRDRRSVRDAAKSEHYRRRATADLLDATYLAAALAGDEEAVVELTWKNSCLPGLGAAALAAYWGGTPLPSFRELLRAGWRTDWLTFKHELGVSLVPQIKEMFGEAAIEHSLEGSVSIYRGASGVSVREASRGLSWTTNRDTACWFAFRNYDPAGFVIRIEIDATEVLYNDDDGWESEVLLEGDVIGELDDHPESWQSSARRYAIQHKLEYVSFD